MRYFLNVSHNRSFKFDLDQLPITHTTKGSKLFGIALMLLSVIAVGVIMAFLNIILRKEDFEPHMLIPLLFLFFIAALLSIQGMDVLSSFTTISIDERSISYSSRSLFCLRQWTEDIDKYKGILNSEVHYSKGNYNLFILELHHSDRKKIVRLFQSTSSQGVRAIGEEFCRKLNLPALEKNGSHIVKRNVDELDKSVRDLVKEGKVRIDFDPSRPPPKGLQTQAAGDMFQVIVNDDGWTIIGVLFALLIPSIFVLMGLKEMEPVPLIIGIFIGLAMVMSILWDTFTRASIKIGEKTLVLNRTTPWGETAGTVVVTSEIESIVVDESRRSKQLLIKTDQQQIAIGSGLSAETLEWLKNCLISIIAK